MYIFQLANAQRAQQIAQAVPPTPVQEMPPSFQNQAANPLMDIGSSDESDYGASNVQSTKAMGRIKPNTICLYRNAFIFNGELKMYSDKKNLDALKNTLYALQFTLNG